MKVQHLIWFLLGMGLLASMSSCKLSSNTAGPFDGATDSEVRDLRKLHSLDSCLYTTKVYIQAIDIIDDKIAASSSEREVTTLKYLADRYLDSVKKYRYQAHALATGD